MQLHNTDCFEVMAQIGCELDLNYFEIAKKRIMESQNNLESLVKQVNQ